MVFHRILCTALQRNPFAHDSSVYRNCLIGLVALMPFSTAFAVKNDAFVETVGTEEHLALSLSSSSGHTQHQITVPGAVFIKLHIKQLTLEDGDRLRITGNDGQQQWLTSSDMNNETGTWGLSMMGNSAEIHLEQTDDNLALGKQASVEIDRLVRGYSDDEIAYHRPPMPESVCGQDDRKEAACYEDTHPEEYLLAQATARLVAPCDEDGQGGTCTCTAWRVGPASNTLMTNNHCLSAFAQVAAAEVRFGFENSQCNGSDADQNQVIVAVDEILVTDATLDMTLFTVKQPERIDAFGYLTLESTPIWEGERIYIPQHPAGRDREMALFSDQDGGDCRLERVKVKGYGDNTDIRYTCDTEGGSSGSPIISRETHRVIGLHHLGSCSNSGVRMDLIYPLVAEYVNHLDYL